MIRDTHRRLDYVFVIEGPQPVELHKFDLAMSGSPPHVAESCYTLSFNAALRR